MTTIKSNSEPKQDFKSLDFESYEPLGDKEHCSQCQKPPDNLYGVVKFHPIMPCYTIYHFLCQTCVSEARSPKCLIEPYDSPEFNCDDSDDMQEMEITL